jgi:hypothetical protein
MLAADGRCLAHATRPLVCRGYPRYDRPVRDMPLPDPLCGYVYEQVRDFVVRSRLQRGQAPKVPTTTRGRNGTRH